MPSLQVRDVPEALYRKLQMEARRKHRSVAQQAIVTLSQVLDAGDDPKDRRRKLMDRIRSESWGPEAERLQDPAVLVREDRERG